MKIYKSLNELYYNEFQSLIADDKDFNYSEDEFSEWLSDCITNGEGIECDITDLSDATKKHIKKLIGEGFTCGEIVESFGEEELYGWWKIGHHKIDCEVNL